MWMGSGQQGGERKEKMNRRKVTANGNQLHCVALKLPFSAHPQSHFHPWGWWGTHQCRGSLGGLNWPCRNPQGKGKQGLLHWGHGCGRGTVSRVCSQPRPCRTPPGRLGGKMGQRH